MLTSYSLASFIFLTLLLTVVFAILSGIYDRRDKIFPPIVELYISFLGGIICSVVTVSLSTDWVYPVRLLAGLALGIFVGWSSMMTAHLLLFLLAHLSRKIRQR